jgi:hypothetical protein
MLIAVATGAEIPPMIPVGNVSWGEVKVKVTL